MLVTALVDGSGMIRNQMGTHNRSERVALRAHPIVVTVVLVTVIFFRTAAWS
jgi:hypothetical protein